MSNLFHPLCAGASVDYYETCPRCGSTMRDNCRDDPAYEAQIALRRNHIASNPAYGHTTGVVVTPTITDDDRGTITATVDGKVVRSWTYVLLTNERRDTMAKAREYAEGWHDASAYFAPKNRNDL